MAQGLKTSRPAQNDPLLSLPMRVNFDALASFNSGPTAPENPGPYWPWVDTSDPLILKLRMYINNSWVIILNNIGGGPPIQVGAAKYFHTQAALSNTWTITHQLNTTAPIVAYVDGTGAAILPDTQVATTANIVVATFLVAQSGKATVVG